KEIAILARVAAGNCLARRGPCPFTRRGETVVRPNCTHYSGDPGFKVRCRCRQLRGLVPPGAHVGRSRAPTLQADPDFNIRCHGRNAESGATAFGNQALTVKPVTPVSPPRRDTRIKVQTDDRSPSAHRFRLPFNWLAPSELRRMFCRDEGAGVRFGTS